jgi:hypothetical protein
VRSIEWGLRHLDLPHFPTAKQSFFSIRYLKNRKIMLCRRNELFAISGIRACYPQFFLERKDGTTTFVGTWDVLEGINDSSSYPEETIEAHPELRTWDRVFANLVESFE